MRKEHLDDKHLQLVISESNRWGVILEALKQSEAERAMQKVSSQYKKIMEKFFWFDLVRAKNKLKKIIKEDKAFVYRFWAFPSEASEAFQNRSR